MLDVHDRVYGIPISLAETKDFYGFFDNYKLFELKSSGPFYSWHKGGDTTKTTSRINRCFGNGDWMNVKGYVCSKYLNPGIFFIVAPCLSIISIREVEDHSNFLITWMSILVSFLW